MGDSPINSIFVALLFILRCFVPIAVLFGVSYLLRKMGLVATELPEPSDEEWDNAISTSETDTNEDKNEDENLAESEEVSK